jgi:hypothetical protein
MHKQSSVRFFGARWDASYLDRAVQVSLPVGDPCVWCNEPIGSGDQGVMIPYLDMDDRSEWVSWRRPWHRDCIPASLAEQALAR